MSFDATVPGFDVYTVGKSHQLVPPKTADHNAKYAFYLISIDLTGPITMEELGGCKYVSKIFDQHTK